MKRLGAFGVVGVSVVVALILCVLACFLPDIPYQRWQLVDNTSFSSLCWSFERLHFDRRPVDVAIIGSSKTLLGLSAPEIEKKLAALGAQAHVANLSVPQDGRNVQWVLVDELLKTKKPKIIILLANDTPHLWGHPAFKYVAPSNTIVFPSAPLLHNYIYDVSELPSRQVRLLIARLFPEMSGLRRDFDSNIYANRRSDFTYGRWVAEGKIIDMEETRSPAELEQMRLAPEKSTFVDRMLLRCCNDGDDAVYTREIAKAAKARNVKLVFVQMPVYRGAQEPQNKSLLLRYGTVLSVRDLGFDINNPALYQRPTHVNHAGATMLSDRIAEIIAAQEMFSKQTVPR